MHRLASRRGLDTAGALSRPVQPTSSAGRLQPIRDASAAAASATIAFAILAGAAARVLPALLAVSIQRDLGWQVTDVAWPIALAMAISALAAPLAARGLERFGPAPMLSASLVLLAISLGLTTIASSPWHLGVVWGIGLGLGGALNAPVVAAMAGARVTAIHCGARFGFLAAMQYLGSIAGLLVASRVADAFGWRIALDGAAVGILIVALVVLARMPRDDAVAPRRPAGGQGSCAVAASDRRVWVLAAIFFICGASTSGLIEGRLGTLCMGSGLGLSSSADVMAIVLLASAVGSLASGRLADRYPARMLLAVYFIARAISLLWLPFTHLSMVELAQFGALFGLDAALTFPALARLIPANLGARSVTTAMGWMVLAHAAGATAASAAVGALGLAGYAVGFACVGLLCLAAAGLVALLNGAAARSGMPD